MHSFTSKRPGRRTAKTGLPAWGPVNAPGQGLVDAGPRRGKNRPVTCRFITPGKRCRMKVAVLQETATGRKPPRENAGWPLCRPGCQPSKTRASPFPWKEHYR